MMTIAIYGISNTMSIHLYEYNGEIVLAAPSIDGEPRKPRVYKVYYTRNGRAYFHIGRPRYYLDEFIRV